MKLNISQSLALVHYLTQKFNHDYTGYHLSLSGLFQGEYRELRIIHEYGMAGKLWNNNGKIYVSGHSHGEVDKNTYIEEQKEIAEINAEIEEILEKLSDK